MISIFSKFKIAGGSERRAVELANGIVRYLGLPATILCKDGVFPQRLEELLDQRVIVVTDCLNKPEFFKMSKVIITINSDSREFTQKEYWDKFIAPESLRGKTMIFLFNFIVSPAASLHWVGEIGARCGIIVTNKRFFDEIGVKEKFLSVLDVPRIVLESPIDPESLVVANNPDPKLFNIHMLSKSYGDKWNDDIVPVVKAVSRLGSDFCRIKFNMMGAKREICSALSGNPNARLLPESAVSTADFFKDSDLFMFFPGYKRQEPWARVIGEAMTCGLPIIALDNSGGTAQQVIHGNNGFLCKTADDFIDKTVYLYTNRQMAKKMGNNSRIYAAEFSTPNVCAKLLRFVNGIGHR